MSSKSVVLLIALAMAGIANAGQDWNYNYEPRGDVVGAPEIDPASAISGMTLLLGGLAVIRGRRNKS